MTSFDWLILALTLSSIVGWGLYKSRGTSTLQGYLLAGRSMRWYAVAFSIMATQASAITFTSTPGQVCRRHAPCPVLLRPSDRDGDPLGDGGPAAAAVSAMYYWEREQVKDIIWAMYNATEPFEGVGTYQHYIRSWRDAASCIPVHEINYEILHANPVTVLMSLLHNMGIPNDDRGNILKVVERQEIGAKRKQIASEIVSTNTPERPYGKTIQLKNLRKGVPGEWKKEFKREDGALMDDLFHEIMVDLGYLNEGDHEWYKKLPARNKQ